MDHGTLWRTYANGGDKSYLNLHAVSSSKFGAQTELLLGRTWITLFGSGQSFTPGDEDNLFAALEYPDRIFHIAVTTPSNPLLRKIAAAMQDSFPVLTGLLLMSVHRHYWNTPSLPDGFLGGSAPCLVLTGNHLSRCSLSSATNPPFIGQRSCCSPP